VNTRPPLFKPVGPASLADEADFHLGPLLVRPSIREIGSDDRHETLEPRIMQVLVVLARAEGMVVSRDELVRQCWGGRIVSDDSINRSIAKLRPLGMFGGSKAFDIETIARVGYRLTPSTSADPSVRTISATGGAASKAAPAEATTAPVAPMRKRSPLLPILAIVAIAAVAAAAYYFLTPRTAAVWTVAEAHQPFIATPQLEITPAFSPNGTMLAYAAGPDFLHLAVYVRMLSGGASTRLTNGDTAYEPVWSPDGNSIAYLANAPGQHCRIMLIGALGGTPRQAGRCHGVDSTGLAWAGNALLYSDVTAPGLPSAIMRLDLTSGAIAQLSHPVAHRMTGDTEPEVSPDGKTVALMRVIAWADIQVVLHDLGTGTERVLLHTADDALSKVWANDSSGLFVARDTQWETGLWFYPVSGAPPQRITTSSVVFGDLASGPKGLLAMELHSGAFDLAEAPATPNGAQKEYANDGSTIFSFAYAPDGTLAALGRQSGELDLLIAGPDKVLHKLIPLANRVGGGMIWSPDSRKIAFMDGESGNLAVNIADRNGTLQRYRVEAIDTGWLDWSADGKSLFVTHLDKFGWRYWRLDPDHPDKPVLQPERGWSLIRRHDGMLFGTKDGVDGIWRIDGTPKKLTPWPLADNPMSWTLSGNDIVYLDSTAPAHPVIKAIPMTGGASRTVAYPQGIPSATLLVPDPGTGRITFTHLVHFDIDIGWMRLTRH
jgi:DNA-binding winged helix-turn-helix (wHTH) protein/Tol biopolymer transport system component